MLWVPTSQAVVARFAPADIRGAYMGVYGSAAQAAWSLTPFAGLQVRHAFGDVAMWAVVAGISLRRRGRRRGRRRWTSRSIARVKGLICAGGTATRLEELTRVTNKHLLPVGRWPMVYYPLQLLQRVGVREVLLVTGSSTPAISSTCSATDTCTLAGAKSFSSISI